MIDELQSELILNKTKVNSLTNEVEKIDEENNQHVREIKLMSLSLEESDRALKLQNEENS